jgi:putative protease
MRKLVTKPELLAPAGNFEKIKWAFLYGADAVYFGGQNYGLRANADNLSMDEIKEACTYAHSINKKVYVTVNIVFHNNDINGLENYIKELYIIGVDAIIISDPLVIEIVKKVAPNLEVHLSTQQSTIDYESCKFWSNNGVKRIVLGREASKKDIKEIIKKSNVEIETFIHGAMCVGYSGRCMLSNYLTNRDSNRGGCSQICRWPFILYGSNKNKIETKEKFSMAVKDLSLAKHVNELIELGVKSFKIEGRMKSVYYIATVINIYRNLIDSYFDNKKTYKKRYEYILQRCASRENKVQYFKRKPNEKDQYYSLGNETSNQDFLGIVLDYDDINKEIIIEERNCFSVGDEITIFGPNINEINLIVKYIKNDKNELINSVRHAQEIVKIPCNIRVYKDDLIRVKF